MVSREFLIGLVVTPVAGVTTYCLGTTISYALLELVLYWHWPDFAFLLSPMFHAWFAVIGTISGFAIALTIRRFDDRRRHVIAMGSTLMILVWSLGSLGNGGMLHPALPIGAAIAVALWHIAEELSLQLGGSALPPSIKGGDEDRGSP